MLTSAVTFLNYFQSFKLQKLNRSMQLRSDSFSKDTTLHTPRLSAMNSVAKSVKFNNVSFMTGEQLCKLRREPQQGLQNPEYSAAHSNMSHIRKRYDHTNQQKLYLDNKIQRLNEQKMKYSQEQKQFQDNKINGKEKVHNLQSQLQSLKLQLLDTQFQKKSCEQIVEVIRHDKVVYDLRNYNMNKYLKHLQFKHKSVSQVFIHKNQEDDRVIKVYQKLMTNLNSQEKQRSEHLNSMEFRVLQKQNNNNSSVLRKSQMDQIAEAALTERDPKQKEWMKVFMTHKLLEKLLKNKIQREMAKFSTVQNAFKNIKISTGVSDAKTMIKKYLSKQQIYGDLLSKIAQNQKQIQGLKKQQEQYLKQIKKSQQQIQFLEVGKGLLGNFRQELKQGEQLEQKRKRCDMQEQKLKQFLYKQSKQLSKNSQGQARQEETKSEYLMKNKQQIKNNFIEYLTKYSAFLDDSMKLQVLNDKNLTNDKGVIQEQIFNKMFRVKPQIKSKLASNNSGKDSIFSKTFNAEQFVEHYEEEQITTANDQIQTIQEQRQNLMKSNQKFMKQLKAKRQVQKQLIVQTLVKNTKEKAVVAPVKKVEQPLED